MYFAVSRYWRCSSVGQSTRLISAASLVQIQPPPPIPLHFAGIHHGSINSPLILYSEPDCRQAGATFPPQRIRRVGQINLYYIPEQVRYTASYSRYFGVFKKSGLPYGAGMCGLITPYIALRGTEQKLFIFSYFGGGFIVFQYLPILGRFCTL